MEYWYDQGELVVVKLVKYNQRFKSIDSLGHTAESRLAKRGGSVVVESDKDSESQGH